jgi:hypothetical protein
LHWERLAESKEKVSVLISTFDEACEITKHSGVNGLDMEGSRDMPITCICQAIREFDLRRVEATKFRSVDGGDFRVKSASIQELLDIVFYGC